VKAVNAHTLTKKKKKTKKFKETLSACQKAYGNCFLRQGRSADSGIHAIMGHSNVRSVLRNNKETAYGHSEEMRGMLTYGVVLLHDNSRSHTAARTRELLEHFNWELFDRPPYSLDLAASDNHLFTYLKNWLRSQRFNNNEEFKEGGEASLSSQAADFFDTDIQKLIPRHDSYLNSGGDHVES
jgi:transposase